MPVGAISGAAQWTWSASGSISVVPRGKITTQALPTERVSAPA